MKHGRSWDARCSEILQRMAGRYHDREIAASIEAETGKRVASRTVADYRRAGALPPCRRNDWTALLKTWPTGERKGIVRPRAARPGRQHGAQSQLAAAAPGAADKNVP